MKNRRNPKKHYNGPKYHNYHENRARKIMSDRNISAFVGVILALILYLLKHLGIIDL